MGKDIQCKWKPKERGVAIFTPAKTDIKPKTITRDKEGHYIRINGLTREEALTIVNTYAPNIRAPQYRKQIPTY